MPNEPFKFQSIPIHVNLTNDMLLDMARSWKFHILMTGEEPVEQGDLPIAEWISVLQDQFNGILKAQLVIAVERAMGDNEHS